MMSLLSVLSVLCLCVVVVSASSLPKVKVEFFPASDTTCSVNGPPLVEAVAVAPAGSCLHPVSYLQYAINATCSDDGKSVSVTSFASPAANCTGSPVSTVVYNSGACARVQTSAVDANLRFTCLLPTPIQVSAWAGSFTCGGSPKTTTITNGDCVGGSIVSCSNNGATVDIQPTKSASCDAGLVDYQAQTVPPQRCFSAPMLGSYSYMCNPSKPHYVVTSTSYTQAGCFGSPSYSSNVTSGRCVPVAGQFATSECTADGFSVVDKTFAANDTQCTGTPTHTNTFFTGLEQCQTTNAYQSLTCTQVTA